MNPTNIVFTIEIPLTDKNNVVTYNVGKTGLKVRNVEEKLRATIETAFPGIEGVRATCRQNPDWHSIVREREEAKNRVGFFKRIFGGLRG